MTSHSSMPQGSCRAFLRQFEQHLQERRDGVHVAHVEECEACRARLERGLAMAAELSVAPALPERLRQPEFLEEIYSRAIDDMADGGSEGSAAPMSEVLADIYQPLEAPDRTSWPLQERSESLEEALTESEPVPATPSWLWQRTRAEVLRAVEERRELRRRFRPAAIASAAILLILSGGWYLAQMKGTSVAPRIVFVEVTEMPTVMHPSAVLLMGTVR